MKDLMDKADIMWLDDPEVIGVNRVPAHSDHEFVADEEEYRSQKSSLI